MPRMQIRGRAPRTAGSLAPRYEARFVNGVWSVFDTERFGHGDALDTQKAALRIAQDLNEGKRKWAA